MYFSKIKLKVSSRNKIKTENNSVKNKPSKKLNCKIQFITIVSKYSWTNLSNKNRIIRHFSKWTLSIGVFKGLYEISW